MDTFAQCHCTDLSKKNTQASLPAGIQLVEPPLPMHTLAAALPFRPVSQEETTSLTRSPKVFLRVPQAQMLQASP